MRNKQIRTIVFAALFGAIAAVLKYIARASQANISFFSLPIVLAGFYFGPFYGLAVGFIADLSYIIFGGGDILTLYTLSTMIWGISGYIIKKMKPSIIVILIVVGLTSLLETSINTLQMYINSKDFVATTADLGLRIGRTLLRLPFLVIAIKYLIDKFASIGLNFE